MMIFYDCKWSRVQFIGRSIDHDLKRIGPIVKNVKNKILLAMTNEKTLNINMLYPEFIQFPRINCIRCKLYRLLTAARCKTANTFY